MESQQTPEYDCTFIWQQGFATIFKKNILSLGYAFETPYINSNIFSRQLRKLFFKLPIDFKEKWYNKSLLSINTKNIIVFDSVITYDFLTWLRKHHPNKRIIFWYWNPVRAAISPENINENICEKWSYSMSDCNEYSLKYNTQFYFNEFVKPSISKPIYDVLFVGKDKGRLSKALYLEEELKSMGFSTRFYVTSTNKFSALKHRYEKNISYNSIITMINQTKSILEILSNPLDGLSLRSMESLFFKKKLITNSETIDRYDFYNKNNIFMLNKRNIHDLAYCLASPYEESFDGSTQSYCFQNWLKRFNL